MMSDDKRMADKLERAQLLQLVEEAEVKHFEAARDAKAQRSRADGAEIVADRAKQALDKALAALAEKIKMGTAP